MTDKEKELLSALFDVAEEDIDYLSYEGQTKWNELARKADEENIVW